MEKNLLLNALTRFDLQSSAFNYTALLAVIWGISLILNILLYEFSSSLWGKTMQAKYNCRLISRIVSITTGVILVASIFLIYNPSPITSITKQQYKSIIESEDLFTPTDQTVLPVQIVRYRTSSGGRDYASIPPKTLKSLADASDFSVYEIDYLSHKGQEECESAFILVPKDDIAAFEKGVDDLHAPLTLRSYHLNESLLKQYLPSISKGHLRYINKSSDLSNYHLAISIGETDFSCESCLNNIVVTPYEDIPFYNNITSALLINLVVLIIAIYLTVIFLRVADESIVEFSIREYREKYQ